MGTPTPTIERRHAPVRAMTPTRRVEPRAEPADRPVVGSRLQLGAPLHGAWAVLPSLWLEALVDEEQPFAAEVSLERVESLEQLLPGVRPTFQMLGEGFEQWLVRGDESSIVVSRRTDGGVTLSVSAATAEERDRVVAEARARVPEPVADDRTIPISFWFFDRGGRTSARQVLAPHWSDIERNYPAATRPEIDRVMGLDAPSSSGRLILWHGPPGTGKTTATRALARAWSSWCDTTVVTEPERLFNSVGLMFELMVPDADEDDADAGRWRLLVVEDADELLRVDARSQSGQALSRLLNLADGFIGQGMRAIVLLSTNERLGGLHPAVARPGRCLSSIEFGRFGRREATEWLGREPEGTEPEVSLAELIRQREGNDAPAATTAAPGAGLYL